MTKEETAKKAAQSIIEWCYRPDTETDENYPSHLIESLLEEQHKNDVEKACKAFCVIECPHLVEYCWQDETDYPCRTFKQFKKTMEEQI